MSAATIPTITTLAEKLEEIGDVPADRILFHPAPGTATAEDLVAIREDTRRICELVDGILIGKAIGLYESIIASELIRLLGNFVKEHNLGIVAGEAGMMQLAPGLVRIPDVSFIAWDRFPDRKLPRDPVPHLAPDLAVEVLSPSNTLKEMARKRRDYFNAGCKLVWITDPETRTVTVYTAVDQSEEITEDGTLDGGDVLPGFSLSVREWFERAGEKELGN
jgi:Uma2 family endonuclease